MQPWGARQLLLAAALAAAATVLAALVVDVPLARAAMQIGPGAIAAIRAGLRVLEVVLLLDLSKFAIGVGLVAAGALIWRWRPALGRALVYVGATHGLARLAAGMLKNVFGRHRPSDVPFDPSFFQDGGISFPSGHTAHAFALFFALLVVAPRAAWAFAPVAVFVMIARILPNDHFLADTLGSIAIAALVAGLLVPIAGKRRPTP